MSKEPDYQVCKVWNTTTATYDYYVLCRESKFFGGWKWYIDASREGRKLRSNKNDALTWAKKNAKALGIKIVRKEYWSDEEIMES